MEQLSPSTQLSLVGLFVELSVVLVFTVLIFGLRRQSSGGPQAQLWSWSWAGLLVGILAITIRYNVVPFVVQSESRREAGPLVTVLYAVYQTGKATFLWFLALGVIRYGRTQPPDRRVVVGGALIAVALAIATVLASDNLNRVVMLQGIVAGPVFAVLAYRVGGLSYRSGLGHRLLTVSLWLLALLWLAYIVGFGRANLPNGSSLTVFLAWLVAQNSYVDAASLALLGLGAVLTLVEDAHREAQSILGQRVEAAVSAEARLAEIVHAAYDGIVTLDSARRIDQMNPAAGAILGVEPDRMRGKPFGDFIANEQRDVLWDDLSLAVRRSEAHPPVAVRRELTGLRNDQTEFPLELALSSYGTGDQAGFVIVLRDLTEQRRLQEDHDRLQQHVAQAARMETVGRMVSGVAHELNNPLTAIIAFAQDLLASARNDEDREALTVIAEQAQRCRVIVGDLLVFARSRREERRRVRPDELIGRVTRVFERDSASHGVRLDIDLASDLPPVDVDPAGMEQVLTNLLTNAIQATPEGGRVGLVVRANEGRLEVVVEDSGPGIAAEALPRIFEPFYTTKEPGRGTGLGLSVSHSIVEQHGGTILAENRGDRPSGARFTVRLPFVDRRAGLGEGGDEPGTADARPDSVHRRVLVVDDEAAIRIAIRRALERRGWSVDEAADGSEALLKLEVGGRLVDYDAVVTDLRMPGMSGVEMYRQLAAAHPSILGRVIVITGDTASPAVVEFLATLAGPHLQKPFDMRALVDLLDQVVVRTAP